MASLSKSALSYALVWWFLSEGFYLGILTSGDERRIQAAKFSAQSIEECIAAALVRVQLRNRHAG